MAEDYLVTDYENTNQQDSVTSGAAYYNTDNENEGGFSIMPPENQFSTQPLESGGHIGGEKDSQVPDSEGKETKAGEWTSPKEKKKITTKSEAKAKLLEVRSHIIFLIDMAKEAPDLIKKPESLTDLAGLGKECIEMYGLITADPSKGSQLNPEDSDLLNSMSKDIEYSYNDVFGLLGAQAQKSAQNVGGIPDMKGLDGALKEMIRSNFGEKNQSELDKIMNILNGTNEYNRLIQLLKDTSLRIVGEVGSLMWAEGLEKLEKNLKSALVEFKSHADYIISFVSGLFEVFGSDPSHPTEGMRKTFDLIDTIINNPFTKVMAPLWTAYKPAIKFCMDGIDMIKKKRDEQFNQIGIVRGLVTAVKKGQKNKISEGMTLGLPGESEKAKLQLLYFMMDMHSLSYKEILKYKAPDSVKTYFWNNMDLVNAGDGRDKLNTEYNNPLNPWDNELADVESSVWLSKDIIWTMLYGNMLTPPGR
jgi:hypothetical protein